MSKRPITVSVDRLLRKRPEGTAPRKLPADDRSCPRCSSHYRAEELRRNLGVCGTCGHHFAAGAHERLDHLAEGGPWTELWSELRAGDPLQFVDLEPYPDRVEKAERKGNTEALVVAELSIRGHACVAAISVTGLKLMLPAGGIPGLGGVVRRYAAEISARLGAAPAAV